MGTYNWTCGPKALGSLVMVLPFIEETVRYTKFDLTKDFNDPVNATAAGGTMPPTAFLCPSYGNRKSGSAYQYYSGGSFTTGVTCYLGVRGTANDYVAAKRGVFGMQSAAGVTQAATTKIKDILDGTSKTFMFGEFRPDSQIAVGQSGGRCRHARRPAAHQGAGAVRARQQQGHEGPHGGGPHRNRWPVQVDSL